MEMRCLLPVLIAALFSLQSVAQPLGADPSIQAPGTVIPWNMSEPIWLTVNLFGSLPPWTIQVVTSPGGALVYTITTMMGYLQFTWEVNASEGIKCCNQSLEQAQCCQYYQLLITDIIDNQGISNPFMFECVGGPNSTTSTPVSTTTTTTTVTVTESASVSACTCPATPSTSPLVSTVTSWSSCPAPSLSAPKTVTEKAYDTVTSTITDTKRTHTTVASWITDTERSHTTVISWVTDTERSHTTTTIVQTATKTSTVTLTTTTTV